MKNSSKSTRVRAWARRAGAAIATVSVASLVLAGCTGTSTPAVDVPSMPSGELAADVAQQLSDATTLTMGQFGASGAIVGVWVPWAGSWVSALGTQGAGSETPVTTDMSFRVGEVTREMTCDALYGMVADGTVKASDSVADYVLGVASVYDDVAKVTLANLCDGTSGIAGIPDQVRIQYDTLPDRQWRPRELASFGLSMPAVGAAGESYTATDTDYFLLGLALERASGLPAREYLAKYVTGPLGLSDTELPTDAPAAPGPAPALTGLQPANVGGVMDCAQPIDMTTRSASSAYTNAGVTSTIDDLGTYAASLAQGTLLAEGQDSRFGSPVPVRADAQGWENAAGGSLLTGPLIGQGGGQPGYATAAYSDPTTGLTIAVVLNSSARQQAATNLALQLAAIASKAPAAEGQTAPESGLTWTAEQFAEQNAAIAVCAAG